MTAERSNTLTRFLLSFYAKRVRRIVPALALFVAITSFAICLVNPTPATSIETGIFSLFGASNIYLLSLATNYFAESTQYNSFTHIWSLGVEEQFYAVVPLIVYGCLFYRKRNNGRGFLLAIMAALTSFSLVYYLVTFSTDPSAAFFLMPARFWEIGLGCISFLVMGSNGPEKGYYKLPSDVLILILIGMLWASEWLRVPATILIVITTAILIAGPDPKSATYRMLTLRPMILVGKLSYSLYLWHWGVLSVGRWYIGDSGWSVPVMLCCMLLMSTLSYFFVEVPLRRLRWSQHDWKSVVAGVYACMFVALLLEALAGPVRLDFAAAADKINPLRFTRQHINQEFMSCHLPKGEIDPIEKCLLAKDASKRIVYVIGDSHASNHVKSIQAAAVKFKELEVHYLVEWGFISSMYEIPKCKDHSIRPCIDDSFEKHMEFFRKELKSGDLVIFRGLGIASSMRSASA